MQEIVKGINALATEELIRANKSFPLFRSDHEALGVLYEEVNETQIEMDGMNRAFTLFRISVFSNREQWKKDEDIKQLRMAAVLCAAEAIQTVAMCDKYVMSKGAEK